MKKAFILLITGLLITTGLRAGGYFLCIYEHDKIEGVAAASYNLLLPVGNFKNAGRDPGGFAQPGHGLEIEGLYYFELGERWRVGVGGNMPFYFFPTNDVSLQQNLTSAFKADTIGNTQFGLPKHNRWFAWGIAAQGAALYRWDRLSLEGNLKIGLLVAKPPDYTIYNGNYVPPDYSVFFPTEGHPTKAGFSPYFSTGLQVNYFVGDCFGLFAGASFTYAKPSFEKDLLYTEMINNEPTLVRRQFTTSQEMMFFQLRLGVILHIHTEFY